MHLWVNVTSFTLSPRVGQYPENEAQFCQYLYSMTKLNSLQSEEHRSSQTKALTFSFDEAKEKKTEKIQCLRLSVRNSYAWTFTILTFLATFYWYWSDEACLYSTTGKINHIHEAYCQYYAHNTLQINMGVLNNICIILMVNLNIFLHSFMTSMPVIWDCKVELQYAAKQQVWPCMTFLTCARLGL